MSDENFWRLYLAWKKAGFPQKLAPSVNRVDNTKEYLMDNIEWLSMIDNATLGSKFYWDEKKKENIRIVPASRKKS
jgi:hypothetical protein